MAKMLDKAVEAMETAVAAIEARDATIATLTRRVEELEGALREAMEWNWLDEDSPPPDWVVETCEGALNPSASPQRDDPKEALTAYGQGDKP